MGSTFRFVHCADLHLGGRFRGVSASDPELGRRMRESPAGSFGRIVDLVIDSGASALVISGDVYDDGTALPSTRAAFASELARVGVPVFVCRGNHDSRTSWDSSIPYPDNVHEFGEEPETFEVGTGPDRFAVTGVSFSESHESRNLVSMLRGREGMFTIACVHCDVDSCSEGYPYAPCRRSDLYGKGIGYWALGHIHRRQVVSEDPWAIYPGNIQGRSIKETGEKGAYLVTVTDGSVSEARFVPTQGYVWKEVTADITGRTLQDLVSSLNIGPGDIARITFTGHGELDRMLRGSWDDTASLVSADTGAVLVAPRVRTSPESGRNGTDDMTAALAACGRRLASASKEEILDTICANRMAAKHRSHYESMSEDDIRSMVERAVERIISARCD